MARRRGIFRKIRRIGIKLVFNTILMTSIISTLMSLLAILATNFTIGILSFIFNHNSNLCLTGLGVCALVIVLTLILFVLLLLAAVGLLAMPELLITNILAAIVGISAIGLGVGLISMITLFSVFAGAAGFLFSILGYTICLMAYRQLWRITLIASMTNLMAGGVAIISGLFLLGPDTMLMPFALMNFLIGGMMLLYSVLFALVFMSNIQRKETGDQPPAEERLELGSGNIFEDPPLLPGHWEELIRRKKLETGSSGGKKGRKRTPIRQKRKIDAKPRKKKRGAGKSGSSGTGKE